MWLVRPKESHLRPNLAELAFPHGIPKSQSLEEKEHSLLSPVKMRKILRPCNGYPVSIISAFVRAVVARLAENDAVIHLISTPKLYVLHVMRLNAFAKFVLLPARIAEAMYFFTATRTSVFLASQCKLLRGHVKLEGSIHNSPNKYN